MKDLEKIVIAVKYFIEGSYGDRNICVKNISEKFEVKSKWLSERFIKKYKEPIHKMINRLRMGKAEQYLKESECSIGLIQKILGYDTNNFYNLFKKATGLTPTEYRIKCKIKK